MASMRGGEDLDALEIKVERYAVEGMVKREVGNTIMRLALSAVIGAVILILFSPIFLTLWVLIPLGLLIAPLALREVLGLRQYWEIETVSAEGQRELIRVPRDTYGPQSERAFEIADNTRELPIPVRIAQFFYKAAGRTLGALVVTLDDLRTLRRLRRADIDRLHWLLEKVADGRSAASLREVRLESPFPLAPLVLIAVQIPGVHLLSTGEGVKLAVSRRTKRMLHGLSAE